MSLPTTVSYDGARLPDFFLIGAAKSGTTTLDAYLRRHPSLFLSTPKEPEFFSDPAVWKRGFDWYASLFATAGPHQLCGDASTTYTRWPHTMDSPELIARARPHAKLVYILRHPLDRAFSHYAHHMRYGVTMTFEEALKRSDIYVDCSRYAVQIERYLRHFERDRLLVLLFDDLKASPGGVLDRIQRFLGVELHDLTQAGVVAANVSGAEHYIRRRTTQHARRIPVLRSAVDRVPHPWRQRAFQMIAKTRLAQSMEADVALDAMRPETRARLAERMRPEVEQLERMLGLPLDHWKE